MRPIRRLFFCALCALCVTPLWADAGQDAVKPKVPDRLGRVTLDQNELGGEINRRICDLIYKNYMALDLDACWLDHFRHRVDRGDAGGVYYGVGKVIDAGSLFAQYTHDPKVAERTQHLIDEIVKTRDPDGYIGFWTREPNDKQNFINWILHEQEYFTLAAVRNYRTTGNPASLADAKTMMDHIIKTFPKNESGVYYIPSPISIAGVDEAAVELYRVSGEEKYLDFAERLQYEPHWYYEPFDQWRANIDQRGFHQYVMLSHMYPETELYRLSGDETRLLKSDWMRHALLEKDYGALLVTGSSSNGEQFTRDQVGTGNIEESCVTAYLLRFFDSLLRLEGDLRFGDILERTIYNALFAAQSPDGRQIRYFTAFSGPRVYFDRDTFCCPGNFRRAVAELPQKVFYTFDGGAAINLYTASNKTFELGGERVVIRQETDYPSDGCVLITIQTDKPAEFALRFRTPRWCESMTAQVNADAPITIIPAEQKSGGYEIRRLWKNGDTLTLDMPLVWRFVEGRMAQAGHVALLRGPVVYCFGGAQNAELVARGITPRDLVLDPATLGEPVVDASIRPDGRKVTLKATLPDGSETVDVTLTEFVDPSGVETYFMLADGAVKPVADELLDEPSTESHETVQAAFYGPKLDAPLETLFEPTGEPLADLTADYVRPEGAADRSARFNDANGTWTVWLCRGKNLDVAADGDKTLFSSALKAYETPPGFAYGSGDKEALGFLADHDPSQEQGNGWRAHFTDGVFDKIIPADQRGEFLYTHPVSDPGKFIVFRFTPNEPSKTALHPFGTIVNRFNNESLTFETVSNEDGSVDFILGNNGNHSNDSTAVRLRVYAFESGAGQKDVTSLLTPRIESGQTKNEIGDYNALFSDPAPGTPKTLKIKVLNKFSGRVSYREFNENAPIEL